MESIAVPTNILEGTSKAALMRTFANNIQIGQLRKVIPQYEWCEEKFNSEREYFFWWLTNPKLGGRYNFKDQITAWETYELSHVFEEVDDDEEFTPSWMEEIELAINNAIRAGNYSESGGQL